MKRPFAFLLFLIPLLSHGQHESVFPQLAATSSIQNTNLTERRIQDFIQPLRNDQRSDLSRLRKVFHHTQKTFLREYAPYSDFSEIFNAGRYDCLTATALFSVVLGELNFEYSIIETNYHIFLLVKTSRGDVLLETTDRFNGFVTNGKEIRQRIGNYRQVATSADDKATYRYHCDLYREVDVSRLPGLLYYNQAVKAFNAGLLENCGELLSKAKAIYDTPRIAEFSSIFLKTVVESKLDNPTKLKIIRQFKGISKAPVLASR